MAKVRRLARRVVQGGSFLSSEPEWRRVQIRILSVLAFFLICVGLLAHGKFMRLWGAAPVYGVEGALVLVAVGLGARRVLSSRAPQSEPKDEELELPTALVEDQLASGDLRPRDLVFERDIWTTLGDSQQFGVAAEGPAARERSVSQRVLMVQITLGLLFALGAALVLFNLVPILQWLSSD